MNPLARLAARGYALADRFAFPPAPSPREHWLRIVMSAAVEERLASLQLAQLSAAEISGAAHAGRPWREFTSLDFPEFDLCAPLAQARRSSYDVVICEQVLEHVIDPCAAARNLRELCVPGGLVIVSTPFLVKVHELPIYAMRDYWRFSARGLRELLERAELEVEQVGSWGNRQAVIGNLRGWSAYRRWHSLRNEPDFPVQVWAFARRGA